MKNGRAFAEQKKNISLQRHCILRGFLCLDADEEVSPELRANPSPELIPLAGDGVCRSFTGAYFPARKVLFLGRWITTRGLVSRPRHDFAVESKKFRQNGKAAPEHCKIELKRTYLLGLRGDLHHYTNPTTNSYILKINYFSDIFLQRQLEAKKKWSAPAAVFRSGWRFF